MFLYYQPPKHLANPQLRTYYGTVDKYCKPIYHPYDFASLLPDYSLHASCQQAQYVQWIKRKHWQFLENIYQKEVNSKSLYVPKNPGTAISPIGK